MILVMVSLIVFGVVLLVGIVSVVRFRSLGEDFSGRDDSFYMGLGMSVGFSLMMPFGLLLGLLLDNLVLGVALGPSLGVSLGVSVGEALKKRYGKRRELTETEKRIRRLSLVAGLLVVIAGVVVFLALLFE